MAVKMDVEGNFLKDLYSIFQRTVKLDIEFIADKSYRYGLTDPRSISIAVRRIEYLTGFREKKVQKKRLNRIRNRSCL